LDDAYKYMRFLAGYPRRTCDVYETSNFDVYN